jgi:hypothetical protein
MEELYDNLFKSGDYTKSFEEFVNQFGDIEKSKVLYNALNESGDYTKSHEEFIVQFGFGEKKKTDDTSSSTLETEDMVSTIEEDPTDGFLASSETPPVSIPVQEEKLLIDGFDPSTLTAPLEDGSIPDPLDTEAKVLTELEIEPVEFKSWKEENLRPESKSYKFFKELLLTDEGEQYEDEQKIQKQVTAYLAQKLNKNLEAIDAADEEAKKVLIEQNRKDAQTIVNNLKAYKKEAVIDDLESRKNLLRRQRAGGVKMAASTGFEMIKAAGNAAANFAMGTAASLFTEADALLNATGADKKGALLGIAEMFLDSAEHYSLDAGETQRSTFVQGKEVISNGKTYIVSDDGVVYDEETHIRVDDILPETEVASIQDKASKIEGDSTSFDMGSGLTGLTSTVVNLFGLISGGKKLQKSLGVSPKVGMGLMSFSSTVASSVESVKDDLMAQGVSEKEATNKALVFGSAIATLDGVFSALAGSNEKLLGSTKVVKDLLIDLAKKKGKDFSAQQLKRKAGDLIKENAKELFIEEIPVLLSERGINNVINYSVGMDVRAGVEDLKRADFMETAFLTLGATTGMGSKRLLTSNQRNDVVRYLSNNIKDVDVVSAKLVTDGLLTQQEADNAVSEVKSMQYAETKVSGAVKTTENMIEAAALIEKKEKLISERENTDPSLRADIDKRINSIDQQLEQLKQKDDKDVQDIINGEKDGEIKIEVTREEAVEALKAENEANERLGLPTIIESEANILKTQEKLIKERQDAIQKQETREVPDAEPAEGVQEVETEVRVTPEQETEVESPIKDNLQENETIVQTRKDDKGRVFTTTKQESVRERDGIKVTKFKFNRGDKSTDQRNDSFVSEEVALADTNYEINPEDRLDLQEGETATYEINEIREGDTGVGASVKFTTIDADGNQIGSFQGDVTLVEKTDESEQTVSEIDEVTITEEKVVPAGKRLFNNPNPETTEISKKYKKERNNETPEGEPITSIDTENSRDIADVYESLEDSPNDPKVQEAYSLMADETAAQHQEIINAGYEVEIWNGEGEPYANAQEMIDDVRDNKHMWIYSTEAGFGDTAITEEQRQQNKLLQDSGFKDKNGDTLLYNDLFRFVHDFFGHTERGNGFGPVGEENAWDVHSRMYTPLARRAMTTETRGQNSWVNFGPQMRNDKGELIKKGEEGYLIPKERAFAPQKMALMPEKYSDMLAEKQGDIDNSEQTKTQKDPKKSLEKTKKDFEQSEQALRDRVKKPTIRQKLRILREKIFDRQTRVKDLLKGVGNKEATKAKNLLVTKAGATGFANFRFKKADDKIYKGLKDQDLKTLDHIIYLRRLKAINENRKAQGKEPYVGINDTDYDTAVAALRGYENELGDKKYKDFSSRADTYFEAMNESLTRMKDSGLISEEVFNQLKDIDYSPIKTLDYVIPDNADAAEIDRMAEISGIKAGVIKTLSDKNLKDIIMDTRWLLSSNLGMIEAKVFENKMLNAFSEAVESAEGDVKTEIENYVLPNPVIGKTKDGKPKRKYDKKTPPGFTKVNFKKDGVDKYMVIDNAYANQLLDIKSNSRINLGDVGKLTGTNILRFFATSGNPLFIVGNTAVDFANILLLSDVYSNNKFKGGAELAFDFVKTFGSKVGGTKEYKKIYEEFMEHGGAMDYLSTDGLKAIGGRSKAKSVAGKAFQSYGNFMSYLGETSEVSFRVAVYSKVKNNLLKDFEKENGRDPSKEEVEDIMNEAAREARETIDFSQGGSIVKAADKALPYLNAGTQGLRKAVDYAAKNPKGFASSMLQAMIMAGGASAASMFMLLRSFGDDEDPEKVLEVLNSISDYEKSNYHILFTGEKDENGEHRYIRIKKLPTIGVASTIAEQLTIKAILKSRGIDYDVNDEALKKSASGISPIDVAQGLPGLINRNPLAAATLTYAYNYDHFYGQEVFKGPRNKKILPSAEGLLDDRVDQIYKDLGQAFGFSPKRSKAAVEKIITSETTNPSIGLTYSFYDTMRGVVGETPTNNEIEDVMSRIVKNTERKLVRSTNKKLLSYKEQDEIKELETKLETGIYLKEKQAYNDIRKRYENNDPFTNEEFKKYILDNFPRLDAKKYAKKYVAYIKNMNGDRSILDIVFEDTPEVQAYRIYKKFGDSFDEDEKKEIGKVFNASRRKFSKKALYIYNQKYRKK